MAFRYPPQIVYNTVKIAKKRGPLGSFQFFYDESALGDDT